MSSDLNSKVNFFFDGASPTIQDRIGLKRFIIYIFRREKKRLELVNYIFSTDKAVQLINKRYLNHKTLTDIITFELSEKNEPIVGEVYISVQRISENAVQYGTTFKTELHRVIFHGALHLCGFRDKTVSEISEMRSKEAYYLRKYFK